MYIKRYERLLIETLAYCRDTTNRLDPFAVAVKKQGVIIGHLHVPK